MHVVIVGAGEVGWYLAERLRDEGTDVAVVEIDAVLADTLGSELDVQVVTGSGTSAANLVSAGIRDADLLAAVTDNDEVNLIASMLAKQHNVDFSIVRLQSEELRSADGEGVRRACGVDVVIDPDADTADEIYELVHTTGADEVYPMAGGELIVVGAYLNEGAPLANKSLAEIGHAAGDEWNYLFGTVTRDGKQKLPRGDQLLLPGDHVRVICKKSARAELLSQLGVAGKNASRVMILGGGAVGTRVAERMVDDGAQVTLVERDPERATRLSHELKQVTVIQGEVTDTELLVEEQVGKMDAVIAVTGEDGSNALACAFAISEGATYTVVVLHSLAMLPLVRRFGVDAALSPRTASANAVLRQVRGDAAAVNTFLDGDAEIDEIEIRPKSRADGVTVGELHLPHNILIGAVVHKGSAAEIVRGRTKLAAGDHIAVFGRPQAIRDAKPIFVDPVE